jgi:hypothetical protein
MKVILTSAKIVIDVFSPFIWHLLFCSLSRSLYCLLSCFLSFSLPCIYLLFVAATSSLDGVGVWGRLL